jgi:SAM-dependent methyltransferase
MVYINCNICGRDDWRMRFPATAGAPERPELEAFRCTSAGYGRHRQIVQCRHCGHVYANPTWGSQQLLDAYSAVEDEIYLAERFGRERTFTKHLKHLERWTGPGNGRRLLDVGAYIGVFVEVAEAAGWKACGLEPSLWAAGIARDRRLSVINGTLDAPELQGHLFDVVTLWDVIEHLEDPASELVKARQLLLPGGIIAIHTMDVDSVAARLMGPRWPWLMDMHLHYFSRKSLRRLLEQSSFEVLWQGAQGRYVTMDYLVTRVHQFTRPFSRLMDAVVSVAALGQATVPLNFGDLFTVYARRNEE